MKISLIAAIARNGTIGRDNDLPWHLPNDLKRFKQLTLGKPVLMGRRTYESIGKPLPGRTNIILSRNPSFPAPSGCRVVPSLLAGAQVCPDAEELMILGGASIYEAALPSAHRLYLTRVDADVEGDTFFPEFDLAEWDLISVESFPPDDRHAFPYTFEILERIGACAEQPA